MISIRVDPKARPQGRQYNPPHLRRPAKKPGRKPRDVVKVKP